jgi:methionyl-tRNA formyltransferase
MTIVFFGSRSEMSFQPLVGLARKHDILAVVRPADRRSRSRRLLGSAIRALRLGLGARAAPMDSFLRERGIPLLEARSGSDGQLAEKLHKLSPELICISTFRWILSREIFSQASAGAINLHGSLLPRHRGAVPLFWIYYHDDRTTGVTVHRVNDRADAGDIIASESFALPRGFSVERLDRENRTRGTRLMVDAVNAIERGTARAFPQNEAAATSAPGVRRGRPMARLAEWDVERVWHFLAGLAPRWIEPLTDERGKPVRYRRVVAYREAARSEPTGTVRSIEGGWELSCRDGLVRLGAEGRRAHRPPVDG